MGGVQSGRNPAWIPQPIIVRHVIWSNFRFDLIFRGVWRYKSGEEGFFISSTILKKVPHQSSHQPFQGTHSSLLFLLILILFFSVFDCEIWMCLLNLVCVCGYRRFENFHREEGILNVKSASQILVSLSVFMCVGIRIY